MRSYVIFLLLLVSVACKSADAYDVEKVLVKQELEDGTYSIDSYGQANIAEYILSPTYIDEGEYSVELRRIDSNLYQIVGTDIYIVTKYCYEYGYNIKVILIIKNSYNYYTQNTRSYGSVVFIE